MGGGGLDGVARRLLGIHLSSGGAQGRRWSRGTPVQPEASIVSPPEPRLACGKNTTCDTHSFVLFSYA